MFHQSLKIKLKVITSCFYAVKPHVVYNTRVMVPSAKIDSVPTTQKSCVVYECSCRCEARYVRCTTQRLAVLLLHTGPLFQACL